MTWLKHTTQRKPFGAQVRMSIEVAKHGTHSGGRYARAVMRLRTDVIDRVGLRYDVMLGTGEHRGKLRLVSSSSGKFYARPLGKMALTYIVYLGQLPGMPQTPQRTTACEVEFFDGGANITIPKWPALAQAAE